MHIFEVMESRQVPLIGTITIKDIVDYVASCDDDAVYSSITHPHMYYHPTYNFLCQKYGLPAVDGESVSKLLWHSGTYYHVFYTGSSRHPYYTRKVVLDEDLWWALKSAAPSDHTDPCAWAITKADLLSALTNYQP